MAISRAIANVTGNAMRYAGAAEVSLQVRPREVVVTVRDHGPGVPESLLASIRQPFVRGETSRNSDTGGAGLGLAIADKISRDHGGDLSLNNRDGGGLEVRLTLPRCPDHVAAAQARNQGAHF